MKKAVALRREGLPTGDCVDCLQCVHVCPTGVDIREGPNVGCIQCGLCIDACDTVMGKIDRPPRLIAYDTDVNIHRRMEGKPTVARVIRARTILYAAIIVAVGGIMLWSLAGRTLTAVNVLHDRNPEFVRLSDGGIRNAYTIRILNKNTQPRRFVVAVEGLRRASLEVVGATVEAGGQVVEVGPDQSRELRAVVSLATSTSAASVPITFLITDVANGMTAHSDDNFRGPAPETPPRGSAP